MYFQESGKTILQGEKSMLLRDDLENNHPLIILGIAFGHLTRYITHSYNATHRSMEGCDYPRIEFYNPRLNTNLKKF